MRDGRFLQFLEVHMERVHLVQLLDQFGGRPLTLPTRRSYESDRRDEGIRQHAQQGLSTRELAQIHGLTERHVRRILRE